MAHEKLTSMANAIRMLTVDAVERAGSGHPGLPMGAADLATVLFNGHVRADPAVPDWPDRDRIVVSPGHGAMLLYALLHLLGYEDFDIAALRALRRLGSPTPGHAVRGSGRGVELTTGPAGEGLAMAVGLALAERMMNAEFGDDVVNHRTFAVVGDGDLTEGVALEALALAGALELRNLVVLFDDDRAAPPGEETDDGGSDADALLAPFDAAGFACFSVAGHDHAALERALTEALLVRRPALIRARTATGEGTLRPTASLADRPLGAAEAAATRSRLGWTHDPFDLPEEARDAWRIAGLRAAQNHHEWRQRIDAMDPLRRAEFERRLRGDLPTELAPALSALRQEILVERPTMSTRDATARVLGTVNGLVPEIVGGAADPGRSAGTKTDHQSPVAPGAFAGRYVYYGMREHGMAAVMNGLAAHGGLVPYGCLPLVLTDTARASLRLAAMMGLRVVYVATHDSIGVGEDGPAFQPAEQLATLRATPNLTVFRPADAAEAVECWSLALEREGPSVIALTRQAVPAISPSDSPGLVHRGAYRIKDASRTATVTIFATGSEVAVALEAASILETLEIAAEVISVPSVELFAEQGQDYRGATIGDAPVKVVVEAGVRFGWDAVIGPDGLFFGMSGFGASAPAPDLYEHFAITPSAIVEGVRRRLSG